MVTWGIEDYCAFISLWGNRMKAVSPPAISILFFFFSSSDWPELTR